MMQVRGPDGKVYGFQDGTSQEEMARAMRSVYGGPQKEEVTPTQEPEKAYNSGFLSSLTRGLEGLGDGLTGGVGPYIRTGVRSLINQQSPQEALAVEKARQEERRADYPVSTLINEMGGNALTGYGLAKAGLTATSMLAPQSTTAQRAAAVGVDAAGMGAVNAASEGRNPGVGAAVGFGLGAGTSAVLDKAGGALSNYLRRQQVMKSAPTTSDLRAAQRSAYKTFEGEDIAVSAKAASGLVDDTTKALRDMALTRRQNTRAFGYLDDIAEASSRGDGVSMQTLEAMRSNIQRDLRGGVQGSEREALRRISDSIDNFFDSVPQSEVLAGGNKTLAYEALRNARATTVRLKKSEVLDEIFAKAEGGYASGDANALRLGLRGIIRNPKQRKLFTAEELKAIKDAADGTTMEAILRQLGKLGPAMGGGGSNSLGAMLGMGGGAAMGASLGPGGAAAGALALPAIGAGARSAADAATRRNAEYVQALVNQTGRLPQPNFQQNMLTDPLVRLHMGDAISSGLVGGAQ